MKRSGPISSSKRRKYPGIGGRRNNPEKVIARRARALERQAAHEAAVTVR